MGQKLEGMYHLQQNRLRGTKAVLITIFFLFADNANANGWEHGAVPYQDLIQALSFDDVVTRNSAVRSLAVRQQPEATQPLVELLEVEQSVEVRASIYTALGKLHTEKAETTLLGCLEKKEMEKVRAACIMAIGDIGSEEALLLLLTAANKDPSALVQSAAIESLGNYPNKSSVLVLENIYANKNKSLRSQALYALSNTGSEYAVLSLLKILENSPDDNIRLVVVNGLGKSGDERALEALKNILKTTTNPVLRTNAAIAIGSIASEDRLSALSEFLKDSLPAVRFVALQALRSLGDPKAALSIMQLGESNSQKLQAMVSRSMRNSPIETIAIISEQILVLETLTDMSPEIAIKLFLSGAKVKNIDIDSAMDANVAAAIFRLKRSSIYGMGYTKSEVAKSYLAGRNGIGNADFRLRTTSIRSLGVLDRAGTSSLLITFLKDDVAEVRWTTASVLGRIEGVNNVAGLTKALEDSHTEVRKQAALGLGYKKAKSAEVALNKIMTTEPSSTAGKAARYALELIFQ